MLVLCDNCREKVELSEFCPQMGIVPVAIKELNFVVGVNILFQ